jgi:hypothetical protein
MNTDRTIQKGKAVQLLSLTVLDEPNGDHETHSGRAELHELRGGYLSLRGARPVLCIAQRLSHSATITVVVR